MGGVSATSLAPVTSLLVCAQNGVKPVHGNGTEARLGCHGMGRFCIQLWYWFHIAQKATLRLVSHLWDICYLSSEAGSFC